MSSGGDGEVGAGFGVSVCLSAVFVEAGDERRSCWVWVEARRPVRWLLARLAARLGLRRRAPGGVALLAPRGLLHPDDPLCLLRPGDQLRVVPVQSALFEDDDIFSSQDKPIVRELRDECTQCVQICETAGGQQHREEDEERSDVMLEKRDPASAPPLEDDCVDGAGAGGGEEGKDDADEDSDSELVAVKRRALALLERVAPPAPAPPSPSPPRPARPRRPSPPPPRARRRRVRRRPRRPAPYTPPAPPALPAPTDTAQNLDEMSAATERAPAEALERSAERGPSPAQPPPPPPGQPPPSPRSTDSTREPSKCANFLANLLILSHKESESVRTNVRSVIQQLVDGRVEPAQFTARLERLLSASPQPGLVGFLQSSLPALRRALAAGEVVIEGIAPPPPHVVAFSPPPLPPPTPPALAHLPTPAAHTSTPATHLPTPAAHTSTPAAHMSTPAAHMSTPLQQIVRGGGGEGGGVVRNAAGAGGGGGGAPRRVHAMATFHFTLQSQEKAVNVGSTNPYKEINK